MTALLLVRLLVLVLIVTVTVTVIDQGTVLDRIDYNMDQVVERVEGAHKELVQADKYSRKGKPVKCIACLLVLITILIIILIVKWTSN